MSRKCMTNSDAVTVTSAHPPPQERCCWAPGGGTLPYLCASNPAESAHPSSFESTGTGEKEARRREKGHGLAREQRGCNERTERVCFQAHQAIVTRNGAGDVCESHRIQKKSVPLCPGTVGRLSLLKCPPGGAQNACAPTHPLWTPGQGHSRLPLPPSEDLHRATTLLDARE